MRGFIPLSFHRFSEPVSGAALSADRHSACGKLPGAAAASVPSLTSSVVMRPMDEKLAGGPIARRRHAATHRHWFLRAAGRSAAPDFADQTAPWKCATFFRPQAGRHKLWLQIGRIDHRLLRNWRHHRPNHSSSRRHALSTPQLSDCCTASSADHTPEARRCRVSHRDCY